MKQGEGVVNLLSNPTASVPTIGVNQIVDASLPLIKVVLIVAVLFYLGFSLVTIKQTSVLTKVIKTKASPVLATFAYFLFGAAVAILILSIIIL